MNWLTPTENVTLMLDGKHIIDVLVGVLLNLTGMERCFSEDISMLMCVSGLLGDILCMSLGVDSGNE